MLTLASEGELRLERARLPACLLAEDTGAPVDADGLAVVDIEIRGGVMAAVLPAAPRGSGGVDLAGRMVWPSPVDMHTHLDKAHIWPRAANPDGSFAAALATVQQDAANWQAPDLRRRMDFALRSAFANGTAAVRTHLDSIPPQGTITWPVFAELRQSWAGRVALQGVALALPESWRGGEGRALAGLVAEHGGSLGSFPLMTPELDADLDVLFGLALDLGLELDFHVDETGDPAARSLRHIALAALRHRFPHRIVCGHCCSLARQPEDEVRRTLDLVAEAGISVVGLPMCNMYLQDRAPGRTPRWRGVTLAHEIRARGIPFAVASDNCRDPFYAYGDLDMHEVFREAVRILHLDHPLGDWPAAVTSAPAHIIGLPRYGRIGPGLPADLVIFEGRRWSEVLSRPESRRTVLRAGRPIDTTPPDYAELDDLFARS
ncbi:MAG TPA: cytosine deaminase [Geminicoccaceae bacterium]|nr:cytosine deaminase [Geminicoccaceae bacterium]